MSDTLVINLFAGPGTGKSTTATGIFSILKLHGVNCEYVPEFAKDLTWESRDKTLGNQIYIFGKQYHRMWRLLDQVDVIITDSPILLGLAYGGDRSLRDLILKQFATFKNWNFFLHRVKPYNPKGRNQTEEEARMKDQEIRQLLVHSQVDFYEYPGDHSAINKISRTVLIDLGIIDHVQPMRYKICHDCFK